jgi:hypothetical protein
MAVKDYQTLLRAAAPDRSVCRYDARTARVPITSRNETERLLRRCQFQGISRDGRVSLHSLHICACRYLFAPIRVPEKSEAP